MKRMLLIVSGVLVLAAAFIIWDAMLLNKISQNVPEPESTEEDMIKISDSFSDVSASGESQEAAAISMIINYESIDVDGNTPEYEMKLTLCEDSGSNVFLRMEFFRDGISTLYELDDKKIPEFSGLFQNRANHRDDTGSYQIKQALLNPIHEQLYLLINGKSTDEFSQTSFYRVDLADMSVHKLFSNEARYGEAVFNRDYSLIAYSFINPSTVSANQENKLFEVYDCGKGEYVVRNNRTSDGQPIGVNHAKDYLYEYEFAGWESMNIVRLSQGLRKISGPDMEAVESVVLYDIRENLLMNADGSEWKPGPKTGENDGESPEHDGSESADAKGQSDTSGGTQESGAGEKDLNPADGASSGDPAAKGKPADVLKAFYSYLQSEKDYDKAMRLLDDGFILRMTMLRQFGVEQISKSDIDTGYNQENVSLYSGLLKAAKLDIILNETAVDDNTVMIKYYQKLELSADSQVRQLMKAELVRKSGSYKIILIEDEVQ